MGERVQRWKTGSIRRDSPAERRESRHRGTSTASASSPVTETRCSLSCGRSSQSVLNEIHRETSDLECAGTIPAPKDPVCVKTGTRRLFFVFIHFRREVTK